MPGESRRYFWRGFHRVRDLPRLLNPAGGAVQNANNSPWWTSLADRLDMARYPSYVERNPLALRPQRALQLLESSRTFTLDEVRALKFDVRVLVADRVLDELLAAGRAKPSPSADLAEAIDVLARWDRRAASESRGTALFLRFWDAYRQAVPEPFAVSWSAEKPVETPRGLADAAQAVAALERAAAALRALRGGLDVAWGDVVRFRAGEMDLPGDGADGSYGLYRVMRFDGPRPGAQTATPETATTSVRVAGRIDPAQPPAGFGDAWVLLVHFSRPIEAWSILAYGQSSQPGSPHGQDQIQRFARHELRRVWFSEADIAANLERSYRPATIGGSRFLAGPKPALPVASRWGKIVWFMLRLSKKTDYALMAMKHLALKGDGGSASAREIAERYDIPLELMAKILQRLVRRGLLVSHQGTRGGYLLARTPQTISVADVIQAVDGPVTVTACSVDDHACGQYAKCSIRDPLWRIKDWLLAALAMCSIYEMATDTVPDMVPVTLARRPTQANC